ncbi:unnamed protein product, partial [Ectocarpus fasciculatus]
LWGLVPGYARCIQTGSDTFQHGASFLSTSAETCTDRHQRTTLYTNERQGELPWASTRWEHREWRRMTAGTIGGSAKRVRTENVAMTNVDIV